MMFLTSLISIRSFLKNIGYFSHHENCSTEVSSVVHDNHGITSSIDTEIKEDYDHDHDHDYDIPWELVIEILSRLPVKSLVRFKCVSKAWYNLVHYDREFIKLHLERSLERNSNTFLMRLDQPTPEEQHPHYHVIQLCYPNLPPPRNNQHPYYRILPEFSFPDHFEFYFSDTRIHGSSNGLVCISNIVSPSLSHSASLCLYNPATRAVKRLPPMNSLTIVLLRIVAFGYDRVSDDYKVFASGVRLATEFAVYTEDEICISSVYSLKSDAWESILNPPYADRQLLKLASHTILVPNTFHWINKTHKVIKCFDLATRRFYEISFPEAKNEGEFHYSKWTVLREQLCMVTHNLDIWILKEQGNPKSWTRIFHNLSEQLDRDEIRKFWKFSSMRSIGCIKDGHDIILVICHAEKVQQFLICCDLISKEARKIEIPNLPEKMKLFDVRYMEPWVESLVPLH